MSNRHSSYISSLLQSKIFFIVLVCIVIVSGIRLSNEIARRFAITQQIGALRHQIDDLRSERETLSTLVESLTSDAYIEEAARKKLHVAKPGESVVVIPASQVFPEADQLDSITPSTPEAWWQYFFSNDEA